ncbi:MAG: response regulator [Lentisphaerae bacterium]|jgi:two-component sensor histidine kinase/AmiR/NasT family two-component response regulator|nr:response regulator [Lentisphaerota bacterium]MBT4819369.1 response regulator [Lentisphaerota bacterium]MBT5606946.1 response regulator [Lentisphaerota bacterium]MBT7055099.1 response regulator [Lentisphaerota bacterium]MBT7842213.1 response regulator [Lentisphaerota bacterium]
MPVAQPKRVLVIDDEPTFSWLVQVQLEKLGYEVVGRAKDGVEGVAKTHELRPDVVLMDAYMPDPGTGQDEMYAGLKATRIIQEECPAAVVLLSAYESPELIKAAGEAGVGAYLTKPAKDSDLERAIAVASARFEDLMVLRRVNGELGDSNQRLELEIEERRRAEAELKESLTEKDVLLREIHHRVKNNLGVIDSLLRLQLDHVTDQQAVDVLQESRNRIKSMWLIHRALYQSDKLSSVDFSEYIRHLVEELFATYNSSPDRVRLVLDLEDVSLDIDRAIPCGLIVNELISNALKYAYPSDDSGDVRLSMRPVGDGLELVVSDDGVGLPEDFEFERAASLGLRLVSLLTRQLKGELDVRREAGTLFKIVF